MMGPWYRGFTFFCLVEKTYEWGVRTRTIEEARAQNLLSLGTDQAFIIERAAFVETHSFCPADLASKHFVMLPGLMARRFGGPVGIANEFSFSDFFLNNPTGPCIWIS
jgi:hypothetical protein